MNRQLRWTALAQLPRLAMVVWLVAAPVATRAEVQQYQPRGKAYQPKGSVPCDAPVNCTSPVNCATPCPTCAGNDPNCGCQKPCQNCKPPCNPPCKPPEQPLYVQPPGMFVQPPASGTVVGPVNQYGLEGGEITLPALSLRLPTVRLPGVSRARQNARMETSPAMAPYVESPAQPVAAAPAAPTAAAPAPMMAAAPAPAMQMMAMPAPQMMMAPPMMMAPMQMPMQMQMMAPPAYAPPAYAPPAQTPPPPVAAPPQPPPDEPPMAPRPPSCDARGVPMAALNAEQKIRQLEIAEQQLQARLEQLRRQIEYAETNQRPPVPTPDLGTRKYQLPVQQPLQTPGVHPVSQPLVPLPVQPTPAQAKAYNERPASFITEPQFLPPSYVQPIREPQQPAARITGFRPR